MTQKVNTVRNPLTIIAIFAGLAEVSGTVALAALTTDLQTIFIWFVIFFPSTLVILFFITLNFNPKVLYAPGDFKDEKNFIASMYPPISKYDISKIEVERENIEVYKGINEVSCTDLRQEERKAESFSKEFVEDKGLVATANILFKNFMNLTNHEDIKDQIIKVGFGMHSDDMYLLTISIYKDKNDIDRFARKLDFMIHVFRNDENRINLEVIGWKSESTSSKVIFKTPEELSKAIFENTTSLIKDISLFNKKYSPR